HLPLLYHGLRAEKPKLVKLMLLQPDIEVSPDLGEKSDSALAYVKVWEDKIQKLEITELLLKKNASLDRKVFPYTMMELAIHQGESIEYIELLIRVGHAAVNYAGNPRYSYSPLFHAVFTDTYNIHQCEFVVKFLQEEGADIEEMIPSKSPLEDNVRF